MNNKSIRQVRIVRQGKAALAAALLPIMMISTNSNADDLVAVYKQAMEKDPTYLAAGFQNSANGEIYQQAKSALFPTLNVEYDRTKTSQDIVSSDVTEFQVGTSDYTSTNYSITLDQPIFNYALYIKFRQSKSEVKRSVSEYRLAQQALIIRTAELYFAVLANQDKLTFAQSEQRAIAGQLKLIDAKMSKGLARKTDLYDVKARHATIQAVVIEAENILDDSQQALQESIGSLPSSLLNVKSDIPLVTPDPQSVDEWVDASLKQNASIDYLEHDVAVAKEEVLRQKGGHYPKLDLQFKKSNANSGGSTFGGSSEIDTGDIVLKLTVPIYQGGFVSSKVKEAAYQHQKILTQLEQKKREVIRMARASYKGVISSISKVNALKESVASQQLALNAKQEGYKAGLFVSMAVLDAERDLYLAKRDYAQARYDYILNGLRLKNAAGTLSEEDIMQVNTWLQ